MADGTLHREIRMGTSRNQEALQNARTGSRSTTQHVGKPDVLCSASSRLRSREISDHDPDSIRRRWATQFRNERVVLYREAAFKCARQWWCAILHGHDDILRMDGFRLVCVSCGRVSKGFVHE